MSLIPSRLVDGPTVNKLEPSSFKTTGAGSALQIQTKRSIRTVRVEVNSIDRNYGKDPYPTDFRWTFPFPVKEIREVRLIGGTIPVPYLNMDKGWNKFTLQETYLKTVTQRTIEIPIGVYTIQTLISKLQTQLNVSTSNNTYTVSQVPETGQIQVVATAKVVATGTSIFSFLFATGSFVDTIDPITRSIIEIKSPARILGFGYADYESSNNKIIAARLPNIWYCLEKSYLYLNFGSNQDLRSVFRGSGRKEPSAIIYNDELNIYNYPNNTPSLLPIPLTKYLNKETYDTVIVPSPASISRISVLEVSLRDMFYNLINTQGRELSLLLELVIVD